MVPRGIERSNLDKVFWPEPGLTKGDLLDYFEAVAPFVLPELRDRPLTVKRYPDGIDGFSFYQKNTPAWAPDWVRTVTLGAPSAKRDVSYTVCNSKRTLVWLANQAAIELHPWTSRVDQLERPDDLVFDMDPPEGDFGMAVEAAFILRDVLEGFGLQGVAKTSGSKGVHVFVPLRRSHHFGHVRRAANRLADALVERAPDLATTEFRLKDRGGRVFVDTGRNAPGAHVVAVYSPRARPAATVSFPVAWDDLGAVRPEDFTLKNVPELLTDGGDPWRRLKPGRQGLPTELTGSDTH